MQSIAQPSDTVTPSEHLRRVMAAVRAAEARVATLPPPERRRAERIRRRWTAIGRAWAAAGLIPRTPPRRAQRRTPRRARASAASRQAAAGADGDGDGDPPPLALARIDVAPLVVTDHPSMADVLRAALALTPRQLRELVDEHSIPHARRHAGARHVLVRVDDVLAALGLGAPAPAASSPPPESAWDEAEIIALAARSTRPRRVS